MNSLRVVSLTPPRISPEHVKQKIVCIRGHRERQFLIAMDQREDKLIFHNYGQGGAGWTFLFGSVERSIKQFQQAIVSSSAVGKDQPVVVIGAGCYGLLTAITLARAGRNVRILARETSGLPSDNAAGFFFSRVRKRATPEEQELFESVGMESYALYQQIIQGVHPFIKQGPQIVPAYYGLDIDPGFAPYVAHGLMQKPEQVIIDFGNGTQHRAMEYHTVFVNPSEIMAELRRLIRELNILIISASITDFNEIPERIIFNCAGLGARDLTDDQTVIPVQGHLITLKDQPPTQELQYMINVKVLTTDLDGLPRYELIYYAPKDEGILGISFLRGRKAYMNNDHEFDRILQRSQQYFKHAA
ncbi:MAG TPA: FAD-dependent oxidoreductase [Candidatus Babeliales bacterium]|nr:FAD-dependent oxidoreductase [Candidatus Babeliales bacterium]